MKLEKGMYVRTKHNGIGKIVEYINNPTHYFFKCYKLDRDCSNCDEYITKADVIEEPSYNIIDLIRENDFVNGCEVMEADWINENGEYEEGLAFPMYASDDLEVIENWLPLRCVEIKSIVTKEQFSQMEYKVGE